MNDKDDFPEKSTKRATVLVAMILFAWAILIGLGAYLFGKNQDFRKPLVIIGVTLAFLIVWVASSLLRSVRLKRANRIGRGN